MLRRIFLLTLLLVVPAAAAPKPESKDAECRAFVQRFYDWYRKLIDTESDTTGDIRAIRAHPAWFSPDLRRALKEDDAASAKSPNEIVGLDSDPFLNSQDAPQHYVARLVTGVAERYRVTVHTEEKGKQSELPVVIPELELRKGQWTFVNFYYPPQDKGAKTTDLLSDLRQLKADRQKSKKKP